MATGDRSKRIKARVQFALDDPSGTAIAQQDRLYYVLNRIQLQICEDASAVQGSLTVTLVGGTELYSLPDGFIFEEAVLGSSTTPIVKLTTMAQVAEIKRVGTSLTDTTTDPIYYYKLGDQIGFMNPAGGAPSGSGTVTLYSWRIPKADGTEDMSDTVDPIIHRRWDTCLELGGIAMLTKKPEDLILYRSEYDRLIARESEYKDRTYTIPYDTTYS